jgi:hypothetical protein
VQRAVQAVGQESDENVRPDAMLELMVDRAPRQRDIHGAPSHPCLGTRGTTAILILAGSAAFVRVRLIESGWMWTVSNW